MPEGLFVWLEQWNEAFLTVVCLGLGVAALSALVYLGMNMTEKWERRRRRKQRQMPLFYPPRKPNGPGNNL